MTRDAEKFRELVGGNNHISKPTLIKELRNVGWQLNPRTIDFYVTKGILKRPFRKPGYKEVFWLRGYIFPELEYLYKSVIRRITIKELARRAKVSNFNLKKYAYRKDR